MPKLSDFAAVIFDMDGLVLDTESICRHAWQMAAQTMGYTFTDAFCESLSGLSAEAGLDKILSTFGSDFNSAEFNALSGQCWAEWVQQNGIAVKRGFKPLLECIIALDMPYCLATNTRGKDARACLAFAGLSETFPLILSRDDVQHGKPAPDIFWAAAERLRVNIVNCLVLEDSYTGVMAADKTGAYVVGVPSVWPMDERMRLHSALIVNDLAELLESFSA
ncbi:HAD-superfamily hydrolase, subfamily IA, variant 3 [Crenothrix polyspora]|uniref:HAD-superfamily hydrolase, subfamily IA, variant 3 n=1 Tax=Crenothrix polyspora TaxID=360316 RepID=A0A1R4HGR6_9GAMM|nr:HAD family phosphatase [Crenothrix polyspora]SJM95415.1 HAD-superfamily hydrolase, subfamily IA, variant 3 [Crenothrix polyspora]